MTGCCRAVGGALWGRSRTVGGGMKVELHLLLTDWDRHRETLHAVYLTMLSVCTYHIKNHKCRDRSLK